MQKFLRHLSCLIVCSTAMLAWAESYIVDAPVSGVELGFGWDSKRNRIVPNRCISFAPVQEGGQKATVSLAEVSNAAELREHLGISASAAINGLVGSGSGSASFAADAGVKSSSTNFAVRASVVNGAMRAGPRRPPALRRYAFGATRPVPQPFGQPALEKPSQASETVDLAAWVTQSNLVEVVNGRRKPKGDFLEVCGDGFVSTLYSGVELYSVISFEATDQSTQSVLKAAVSASYGIGSGSASYNDDTEKKFARSNTKMSFQQRGGAGGPLPSSRELLARKLELIAAEAADAPEFFDLEITPYDDLPLFDLDQRADHGDDLLVDRYLELKSFYNDLADVLHNSGKYTMCYPLQMYEALQDKVARVLLLLERAQSQVVANDWNRAELDKAVKPIEALGLSAHQPGRGAAR